MLKQVSLILISIIICSNAYSQATDLKEYGLKGKVKTVTAYSLEFNERKDAFDMNKENCDMKTILFFNTKGNIDSAHTYGKIDKKKYGLTRRIYEYKLGIKTSYTTYDADNDKIDLGTYNWLDKYSYSVNSDNGLFKTYIKTSLNKNLRELSSEIKISSAHDEVYINESYKNTLNKKGHIVYANFLDLLKNDFYKCDFNYLKFDKYDNPIELKQNFPNRMELNKYIIRTIEYYN